MRSTLLIHQMYNVKYDLLIYCAFILLTIRGTLHNEHEKINKAGVILGVN